MAEVIVITTPGKNLGFELAGFDTITIEEVEATETIDQISSDEKYGLVCIEEKLYMAVKKDIAERIRKKGLPVVMPLHIPDTFAETSAREGHIARLIRRTIGYQVKLKK
ncbi:MAG: V-type ATP synthase subunit F [Leptospirales bacterium]